MKEKTTTPTAVQAPETTKDIQASLMSLSDAKAVISERDKTIKELESKVGQLEARIAWLMRQWAGRKSEKQPAYDPNWPDLFQGQFDELLAKAQEESSEAEKQIPEESKVERKRKRENRKMMEDLPILEEQHYYPEGMDLSLYKEIGTEVTYTVECEPGKLYRKAHIRHQYALKDSCTLPPEGQPTVAIAPMPALPIYKGIPGPTLLAELLLNKYEYHLPFYRQVKMLNHMGMHVKDNTVNGWFGPAVDLLRPLYDALLGEILKSDYTQSDETTVPVIDHDRKKTVKEWLWGWRAVVERLVLFHYSNGSRAGKVIQEKAKNYKGYMQCDGFAGYETAFKANPAVRLVACMAHIRRKFEAALDENKAAAQMVIGKIQKLYMVERMCDEAKATYEERRQKREALARPIMNELKQWMEAEGVKYSQESLMGKAVTYAYNRWDNMMRYLEDGRIKIDNNLMENAIRPIALGRKNYLFCGSHDGAEDMAVVCSLLATCKAQEVNPREYLNDIIEKMPRMKGAATEELVQLLPHKWKLQHRDN